jgi:hypothetical protein
MTLAHCILGKFLGVGCHCFPLPLDVPTFSARCLHVQRRERPLAVEGETLLGWEMFRQISSRIRLPRNSRDLLHAANLRHGTDGFTSPPKEGVLRIFSIQDTVWIYSCDWQSILLSPILLWPTWHSVVMGGGEKKPLIITVTVQHTGEKWEWVRKAYFNDAISFYDYIAYVVDNYNKK